LRLRSEHLLTRTRRKISQMSISREVVKATLISGDEIDASIKS
jgi:hypothetical protein